MLAASFSYPDIAFLVLIGLGGLCGLLFGFHRTFKGILLAVAIMLISVMLVGLTSTPVRGLGVSTDIENSILSKTSAWGDIYNEPIYVSEDGSFYVLKQIDGSTEKVALENAMGDGITATIKGKFVLKLATWFIKEDGETLAGLAASQLTSIIMTVLAFVVYCIALGIIAMFLRYIFKNINDSDHKSLKWVDRILGLVTQLALTLIFVLVIISILKVVADKASLGSINDLMNNSIICGYFYNNNPLSSIFTKIFG